MTDPSTSLSSLGARTLLAQLYEPIAHLLKRVEGRMDREVHSQFLFVNGLCDHARTFRGKMLRPALVLLSGQAVGEIQEEHITLAAVVELVHLATLVHDDVLDDAHIRRKKETINELSGNEAAVLLGDYLISHAFHLCSSLDSQFASRLIGATTNTVCEGELMQVHHRGNLALSEAEYLEIIRRKTASLTGACCRLGAKYAQAGPDEGMIERLHDYGMHLGIAFQIIDDILDLAGAEREMGKTLGTDLQKGKITLPLIHALAHGAEPDRMAIAAAVGDGDRQARERIRFRDCVVEGMQYAARAARRHIDDAVAALRLLPGSPAKSSLTSMAHFVLERQF